MKGPLLFLYRVYVWLVLAPVVGLSTLFFGSLTVVLVFVLPARLVGRISARPWARLNAWLTPMWVTVVGREHLDPRRSYVIVANHQSYYDVFALYGWLDTDIKWVMKAELRKVPVLGIACERIGHIFIDRSNRQAALASIDAAKPRLVPGTSVVFFAEGTRSRDGRLGPFKKGAFRFALDTGLPILPVTTSGTAAILPPEGRDLRPGRARLTIHPAIEVAGLAESDLPDLIERVRAVVASALPPES